jgi:hypothetical protein
MIPLLLAVFLAAAPEPAPRLGPPPTVSCPRDHLTSYTGRVLSYRRTPQELALTIHTDWDTTEKVRLAAPRLADMTVGGTPFATSDWPRIESATGHARPGLRATAWVCDDGRRPMIDWQPPATAE